MKKDFIYILIIISVLLLRECRDNSFHQRKPKQNATAKNDSINYYKNALKLEVAEKTSYIFDNLELRDLISRQDIQMQEATKKWKSILAAAKVKQEVKLDTIRIPFEVPVKYNFERFFEEKTDWYYIEGIASNIGISINKFQAFNTQSIVFGRKKLGMFKTEIRAEVTNSNPFIKTTSLDSYQFVEKQKRFGISVIGGYLLTGDLKFQFGIGLGVSYDLIRF